MFFVLVSAAHAAVENVFAYPVGPARFIGEPAWRLAFSAPVVLFVAEPRVAYAIFLLARYAALRPLGFL